MLSVSLGPFAASVGRLLLLAAVVVALTVAALLGRRRGVASAGALINLVLLGLIAARVVFVARYLGDYRGDWLGVLDVRDGGFDALGGAAVGCTAALWLLWRHRPLRLPLGAALLTGAATWAMGAGAIAVLEAQVRALPAAALRTLEGAPVALQGLGQGRPRVINLWATWCPPCRREMPVLAEAQQARRDITFVFANQGEEAPQVERFLDGEGLVLENVLLDPRGELGRAVSSMALPTTLFYDAEGRLVDTHFGELSRATLRRGLERLAADAP